MADLSSAKIDPAGLIKFDCAGVAMRAFSIGDSTRLGNLLDFASWLRHYANMAKECFVGRQDEEEQQQQRTVASAAAAAAAVHQMEGRVNDPKALLEYDPAGVVIQTGGNQRLLGELVEFASNLQYYANLMKQNLESAIAEIEVNQAPDTATVPDPATSTTPMPTEQGQDGNPDEVVVESDNRDEERKKKRKPEEEDEEEQHQSTASKRSKQTLNTDDDDNKLFKILEGSKLRHSFGLTRKVINNHKEKLGLLGGCNNSHAIARVKGESNKVSHLVLQHDWLDISLARERQNFHWRMGAEDFLAPKTILLDPSKHRQKAVPIFLYEKTMNGPQQLYYIGHYECVQKTKINNGHETNELELEFRFGRFDQGLADALKDLAS